MRSIFHIYFVLLICILRNLFCQQVIQPQQNSTVVNGGVTVEVINEEAGEYTATLNCSNIISSGEFQYNQSYHYDASYAQSGPCVMTFNDSSNYFATIDVTIIIFALPLFNDTIPLSGTNYSIYYATANSSDTTPFNASLFCYDSGLTAYQIINLNTVEPFAIPGNFVGPCMFSGLNLPGSYYRFIPITVSVMMPTYIELLNTGPIYQGATLQISITTPGNTNTSTMLVLTCSMGSSISMPVITDVNQPTLLTLPYSMGNSCELYTIDESNVQSNTVIFTIEPNPANYQFPMRRFRGYSTGVNKNSRMKLGRRK